MLAIGVPLKVSYFINQYPKVSHSFIRREILALEKQGFEVQRIALRGRRESLPDPEDRLERSRTRYILEQGVWRLAPAALAALMRAPRRFGAAVLLALRMAWDSDRPLPYHLVAVAEACVLLAWVRRFGSTRVHAHFGTNSAEVAMLARELGGPPFSFTVHGPEEFHRPVALAEKVRRASFVAAISSFGRSQIYIRSQYCDWPKIFEVRCGLDQAFCAPALAAAGNVPPPRLLCVGRLCEAKGQLLLLEAVARLAAQGVDFELVLAGDGPLRRPLEAFIEQRRLTSRVRITGWLSGAEVREQMLAARALVVPSFAEGLPVVIMEAMALRRPVVATYVAGIPELVTDGVHGWLVPAGSVDELARALERCLATPAEELRRIGEAAHERVSARHCLERETAKLAELFSAPA